MLDSSFDQKIFDWATRQDLEDLRLAVIRERDKAKQTVYAALYDYALAKKQDQLLKQKKFIS